MRKYLFFLKEWQRRPEVYNALMDFFRKVFSDSDKCRREEQPTQLSEQTSKTLEHISIRKDKYLFEAAMHIPEKPRLIVTVDEPLCDFLKGDDAFAMELLPQFLLHHRTDLKAQRII